MKNADIFAGGFPCQAFSIAGKQLGFDDPRGTLVFSLLNLVEQYKPRVVFLENVPNFEKHNGGKSLFEVLLKFAELGYHPTFTVFDTSQGFNLSQARKRFYLVAFRSGEDFLKFNFPCKMRSNYSSLSDFIDFDHKQNDKYYYNADNCKFYDKLENEIDNSDHVYQWRRSYVRENRSGLCPTLTASMGMGGNNVPIIKDKFGIRKLTPRECFNFQGFSSDFKLPKIADSKLYKQAGNSVAVPVIKEIAICIKKALALK